MRFVVGDVAAPGPAAELVLANLTGAMLIARRRSPGAAVVPGGVLIVSGFMDDERPAVEAALSGFTVESRIDDDGWCAVTFRRG